MQYIKELFYIFDKMEKRQIILLFVSLVICAFMEAFGIGLILPFLNILGNEKFLEENPAIYDNIKIIGIYKHIDFVYFLLAVLVFWYLLKNIFSYIVIKRQVSFSVELQKKYAKKLYSYYLRKDYTYHLNNNTENLISNIQSSLLIVFSRMLFSILFLCTEVITASFIIFMLIIIDPVIALSILFFMLLIAVLFFRTVKQEIAVYGEEQNKMYTMYLKWLNQGLNGIKEIKVLNKEQFFINNFNSSYVKYSNSLKYYQIISQMPRFLIEGIVTVGLLLLIAVKLMLNESPHEIIAVLGVLSLAAFRLMPCINRIISLNTTIKYSVPAFNLIKSDLISVDMNSKSELVLSSCKYKNIISINNISYKYNGSTNEVLHNLNFVIPKGKFVGLVGPSGAGKTTFVDILLGLLQPSSGEITVDGINIFENVRSWQANLSYVPQSIYLIDGTIKENIALGVNEEEIDDDLLNRVLHMAELYDFVYGLPEGINTNVGERGVKLSGGQRQRIGIARALYNKPEVLILDEATSALDSETEKNITDTILKLKGQITIIAIAHRLSTLEQCDFKVKFENGSIKVI